MANEIDVSCTAELYAHIWASAINMQAGRIFRAKNKQLLEEHSNDGVSHNHFRDLFSINADSYLFIVALHQMRMTALLVERISPVGIAEKVRESIQDFDVSVPDVKKMRNALAHFDEYLRGEGSLQKGNRRAALTFSYWTKLVSGRELGEPPVVDAYSVSAEIAPELPPLEVEVFSAGAAAFKLYHSILRLGQEVRILLNDARP